MTTSENESSSLFYVDENGKKRDAGLHDEPSDPHAHANAAVARAIARGRTLEDAQREYGHTPAAPGLSALFVPQR